MNSSINYSGFTDMFIDSDDEFEPYGCSETNDSLERIYNSKLIKLVLMIENTHLMIKYFINSLSL